MSTWDALDVGDVFSSEPRTLSADDAAALVQIGGYTHPLFTDAAYAAASPFGRSPLPGEAVLLLMGGMAESTERFDETTIALVGLDEVRFLAPAFGGDALRLDVEVVGKEPSPSGARGTIVMAWRCLNQTGDAVAEARARMLFRIG